MSLNLFKIKTSGIHYNIFIDSFFKKKKKYYFNNFNLLKKTKGFFGLKKNNSKIIRGRKRSQTNIISRNSFLLLSNKLPFMLVSILAFNKNLSNFFCFKSASNLIFFLKFKATFLNLFSYAINQQFVFFEKSFFSILRIFIFWTNINDDIILIRNWNYTLPQFSLSYKSKSRVIGINTKLKYFILLLPSKSKKIFFFISSCLVINSDDSNVFLEKFNRDLFFKKKAGASICKGFKSKVRGVAMNPVDHPHGGRTKTIKLPLTPWGLITK